MKDVKRGKKIKFQIALFYIISTVSIMLIAGFYLYFRMSNIILDESLMNTKESVDKSGKYVEMYIEHLSVLSTVFSENEQVIRYLQKQSFGESERVEILQFINSTIASDSYLKSIIIVSKDGRIVSNEKDLDMTMSSDMMEQTWYQAAISSGGVPVLTSARMQDFSMNKDEWVISITQEITNENGDNIGVLLIDVDYNIVEEYLLNLELGVEGYAFIINSNNEVVFHEDTSYFIDETKQNQLIKICTMNDGYDKEENVLIHKYQLQNADWTLIGVSSLDQLDALNRQIVNILMIIGVVLLIVLVIGSSIIADRITDPIRKLEKTMSEFEEGLEKIDIDENGSYEAISLAKHYNQMVEKISLLMSEITMKEKDLREYEIKVLHSQINPHFLYNTLDTIVWMAEFNDSDKVIAMTKSLANFFRLSLNGGNEFTTIENELNHIKEYLFIQKERYGDELNYEFVVDEEIGEVKIPKIILQPIIENSIYHGIRGLDRKGYIKVENKINGNNIEFIIEDNGKGFDNNNIDGLIEERKVKLGGVGINNVDKRIKLYYGDNYGLNISSIKDTRTTVTITIPSNS